MRKIPFLELGIGIEEGVQVVPIGPFKTSQIELTLEDLDQINGLNKEAMVTLNRRALQPWRIVSIEPIPA